MNEKTEVFVKVEGELQKYEVATADYLQARLAVIDVLNQGFRRHGAVLALVRQ